MKVLFPILFLTFKESHKGTPITISVRIQPKLHMSTDHGWVFYANTSDFSNLSFPKIFSEILRTSGGIYSGVIIPKLLGYEKSTEEP